MGLFQLSKLKLTDNCKSKEQLTRLALAQPHPKNTLAKMPGSSSKNQCAAIARYLGSCVTGIHGFLRQAG